MYTGGSFPSFSHRASGFLNQYCYCFFLPLQSFHAGEILVDGYSDDSLLSHAKSSHLFCSPSAFDAPTTILLKYKSLNVPSSDWPVYDNMSAPSSIKGQASFCVTCFTNLGENVTVVGSIPELGEWDVRKGLSLRWSEGNVWLGEVAVTHCSKPVDGGVGNPHTLAFGFKYVLVRRRGAVLDVIWEAGGNRHTQVWRTRFIARTLRFFTFLLRD